jgi:hypothetical protein
MKHLATNHGTSGSSLCRCGCFLLLLFGEQVANDAVNVQESIVDEDNNDECDKQPENKDSEDRSG